MYTHGHTDFIQINIQEYNYTQIKANLQVVASVSEQMRYECEKNSSFVDRFILCGIIHSQCSIIQILQLGSAWQQLQCSSSCVMIAIFRRIIRWWGNSILVIIIIHRPVSERRGKLSATGGIKNNLIFITNGTRRKLA